MKISAEHTLIVRMNASEFVSLHNLLKATRGQWCTLTKNFRESNDYDTARKFDDNIYTLLKAMDKCQAWVSELADEEMQNID